MAGWNKIKWGSLHDPPSRKGLNMTKGTKRMKTVSKFGLVFAALILLFPGPSFPGEFKITRVYDGDTVKAEKGDTVIYIMLLGIDAPEMCQSTKKDGQPFGHAAQKFLSDLILNRLVKVRGYGKAPHPHENIISVLYVNGKNVNLEMVRQGLAEVQRENLPPNFDIAPFLKAEEEARLGRKGVWMLGDRYVSPTEWRKRQRGG